MISYYSSPEFASWENFMQGSARGITITNNLRLDLCMDRIDVAAYNNLCQEIHNNWSIIPASKKNAVIALECYSKCIMTAIKNCVFQGDIVKHWGRGFARVITFEDFTTYFLDDTEGCPSDPNLIKKMKNTSEVRLSDFQCLKKDTVIRGKLPILWVAREDLINARINGQPEGVAADIARDVLGLSHIYKRAQLILLRFPQKILRKREYRIPSSIDALDSNVYRVVENLPTRKNWGVTTHLRDFDDDGAGILEILCEPILLDEDMANEITVQYLGEVGSNGGFESFRSGDYANQRSITFNGLCS